MSRHEVLLVALIATAYAGGGSAAESVGEAFKESDVIVDWRVRYESVEQAEFAQTADAFTNRLRAGFETGALAGTTLLAEAVWIEDFIDDYNSTTNGETGYPVVADPSFAAINRFSLTNKSLENTTLTLGRQRIVHDDTRFVGNVAWRQNEQTFDGLRAQIGSGAFAADLAYATQVNRIFGPDSGVGKWEGDIVLANVSQGFAWGKLAGFGYLLDFDNAAAMSSNTLGLKASGAKVIGGVTGTYAASFARQTDAGDNATDYEEDYYFLEGGIKLSKVAVALGWELLGGDGTAAFSMPLATLHAFQGWADKFLTTPAAGLADTYLKVTYALGAYGPLQNLTAVGFLHKFDSDAGSTTYGDELDLSLVAQVARMTFTLKYASYSADMLFTDTDKLWLSMDFSF